MSDIDAGMLRETVLHDWHAEHGAKMVHFASWDMPVQYKTGAIQEHLATRRHAGLFDISHMGRFEVDYLRSQVGIRGYQSLVRFLVLIIDVTMPSSNA